MIVLGLTGSIGMGKSTTADMFRDRDAAVYDADAAVHALYMPGGAAVEPINAAFPGVVANGAVDRGALRQKTLGDRAALARLESIVHPLVAQTQLEFRQNAMNANEPYCVLDIPLLFETGGAAACDYVAVVTAPPEVQRERVLARGQMTEAMFEDVLKKQMPDAEKRAHADFVIMTAFGLDFARAQVDAIIELLIRLASEKTGSHA